MRDRDRRENVVIAIVAVMMIVQTALVFWMLLSS